MAALNSLAVVRAAMKGLSGITITSTYRTPQRNAKVGGSKTSWHMNEGNPAVDVGGPDDQLDELARRLGALGYDAELLWRTDGHHDHVHYAIRSDNGRGSAPSHADHGGHEQEQTAMPPEQQYEQSRSTWSSVLDSMSQMVMSKPEKFADMYGMPDEFTEVES